MLNLKRSLGFGVMFWILAFVSISVIMFVPWFKDSQTRVQIAWWILEIPIVLLLAKWYFKTNHPTAKEGLLLGLVALVVGIVLDSIITVPLFVKSYNEFFGNPMMLVGWGELLILTTFAGFEFDGTYTSAPENKTE